MYPMSVMTPKLEYAGEVWEGNAKLLKQLETAQMTAAKQILRCSSTTRNTALTPSRLQFRFGDKSTQIFLVLRHQIGTAVLEGLRAGLGMPPLKTSRIYDKDEGNTE